MEKEEELDQFLSEMTGSDEASEVEVEVRKEGEVDETNGAQVEVRTEEGASDVEVVTEVATGVEVVAEEGATSVEVVAEESATGFDTVVEEGATGFEVVVEEGATGLEVVVEEGTSTVPETDAQVLGTIAIALDTCRSDATKGQEKSRAEMLQTTREKLVPLQENDVVLVPVSEFDRGRLDCRNVPGIVMAVRNGNYQIGTKHGIVKGWFSRNHVIKADYEIMSREMVDEVHVLPFRRITTLHSRHGGQGFTKCSCQGLCMTKRCQCRKKQTMCHSHCHPQNKTCKNK